MRLHENWELFSDALQAASQPVEDGGLGIKSIFIEKDYWICRSLSLMAANDKDNRAIFKGGTSLTKAYGIGKGWQNKDIKDSPIINDLHNVWSALSNVYAKELPDLAYKEIPMIESIENSMEQLILYLTI